MNKELIKELAFQTTTKSHLDKRAAGRPHTSVKKRFSYSGSRPTFSEHIRMCENYLNIPHVSGSREGYYLEAQIK